MTFAARAPVSSGVGFRALKAHRGFRIGGLFPRRIAWTAARCCELLWRAVLALGILLLVMAASAFVLVWGGLWTVRAGWKSGHCAALLQRS